MSTTESSTSLSQLLATSAGEEAWGRFWSRYEPVLLGVARRAGLAEADARDVVQETMLTCVSGLREGKYDPAKGRLRAWIRGVIVNKIHEAKRRLANRELQIADGTASTAFLNRIPDEHTWPDIFEDEWERALLSECMRAARGQMDGQTFRAFELYALEDWPVEKVAEQLRMTANAVYIAKSRVLTRLRQLLEEIESNS